MKLGVKAQYALLFVLYLHQNGRSSTFQIAKALGISTPFLDQVARLLRIAGIVKSTRGPGGGYSVVDNPTVGQVLAAVDVGPFIDQETYKQYEQGDLTQVALLEIVFLFTNAIRPVLNEPVINLIGSIQNAGLRPITSGPEVAA
jgi:Rrf2 family protein